MKKITKLIIPLVATASAVAPITTTLSSCSSAKRQMNEIARKIKTDAINIFIDNIIKTHRETFNGQAIFDEIQRLMKEKAGINAPTGVDTWSQDSAVKVAIKEAGFDDKQVYGNMWYDLAPTDGHESDPTIILQCHTDMEMSGVKGLLPGDHYIYDEANQTIKTDETVPLGADDGIAVATFIAIAIHRQEFPHGKVRLIFSPDGGAEILSGNVKYASGSDYLKNYIGTGLFDTPYVINFDGTKQSNIYRSSAGIHRCNWVDEGGIETEPNKQSVYEKFTTTDDNYSTYTITVEGLLGGHSGNQMNLGRGSALKMLCEMLIIGDEHFHIQSLDCPEQANYNICHKATVTFIAPKYDSTTSFTKRLESFEKTFKANYPVETGIKVSGTMTPIAKGTTVGGLSNKLSFAAANIINITKFGPLDWFDTEHTQVLTSTNVGPMKISCVHTEGSEKATLESHITTRSASRDDLEVFSYQVHEMAEKVLLRKGENLDAHLTHNESPAWERLENNHLSNMLVSAYSYFKYSPVEFNTHSWVEAAVFPDMLAEKGPYKPYLATIGCTIVGSGTVNETVYLQTLDTPIKGIVYVLENAGGLPPK